MSIPCVIALPVGEARRMLEEAGVAVAGTVETGPPEGAPSGPRRVVGQRAREEGVELVVAASVALSGEEDNDE